MDFTEFKDIPKKLLEMVPGGLDKALDCGTFHEPKTLLHKVQKTLMLETDVPETANEMIMSVRKMGSCGLISVYAALTNGFNIGMSASEVVYNCLADCAVSRCFDGKRRSLHRQWAGRYRPEGTAPTQV